MSIRTSLMQPQFPRFGGQKPAPDQQRSFAEQIRTADSWGLLDITLELATEYANRQMISYNELNRLRQQAAERRKQLPEPSRDPMPHWID